jgi:hypothetical protein
VEGRVGKQYWNPCSHLDCSSYQVVWGSDV